MARASHAIVAACMLAMLPSRAQSAVSSRGHPEPQAKDLLVEEKIGPDLLSPERIATLPKPQRAAWLEYMAASRRLHARDTVAMASELAAEHQASMTKAPYSAPDFRFGDRGDPWLHSDSAVALAESVLTFQTPSGGWKRTDMSRPRTRGMSYYSETDTWHYAPTFDNGATTGQLRLLGALVTRGSSKRLASAFERGIHLVLAAQQPNGCWPQSYPLEGGYHDAVTFNDDVTVLVLKLLDDVATGRIGTVTADVRGRARKSAALGVSCLLRAQVRVHGARAVWGQQHDPITLAPAPARSYELAGLAGRESASILVYLMTIEHPDTAVVAAVHGAAAWFRSHAITGYRYDGANGLRVDAGAGPIWARVTEISTDRPIFANRDGVKLYDWDKLVDRRSGYGWYGVEPAAALKTYDAWAQAHPAPAPPAGEQKS